MKDWDKYLAIVGILVVLLVVSLSVKADTLVQEFKNPSFSGVGTSAAWLTIDEQQFTRNQDQVQALKNELEDAIREEENSTLNKFIRSLQSRVLSRMAQDITSSLFDETGGSGGEIMIEGNRIVYSNDGESIILIVEAEDGSFTEIVIPIGIFGVCSENCG
jgi:hypothetical protein